MLALVLVLVQAVWGLAPFYSQQETIDRTTNGQHQRSYLVIFNEKAPSFGFGNLAKLQSWLPVGMPELEPENVQWVYEIDANFRGFAVWTSTDRVQSLLAYDFVKYVEEDQVMRIAAPFTQRPDWGQVRAAQKGARNLATSPANQYNGTNYPSGSADTAVWDWTTAVYNGYRPINNGATAKIWVVDTGVFQPHQEFGGRVRTSMDYVTTGGNATDCNGHGTHCAGSAAGAYRGLATAAEIGNVRVLNCQGSGTNAAVINGFNYVTNNQASGKTNILSASLGGGASQASDDAINSAAAAGVIPVVAAGNSAANACNYSPARAAQAITIVASAQNDAIASFSNFGTCCQVAAPGVSLHSSWYTSSTAYNTISGTSMATPIVAGAIALFTTSQPSQPVSNSAVRAAITRTGSPNLTGAPAGTPNYIINGNWN